MNKFLNAKNIAVISHMNPDCDALGSSLGVYHALKNANCNAYIINKSILPKEFDFLPGYEKIGTELLPNTDIIISLDCGSFKRLGIEKTDAILINIDHHKSNEEYGDENIIDASAISASCVAFKYLLDCGFEINKDAATCFYAAMLSDSGYFCFDGVNKKSFDIASRLCDLGANPAKIGQALSLNVSQEKVKLEALVFSNIQIMHNTAVVRVSASDFRNTNAKQSDTEGFAEKARAIRGIWLGICFRELENTIRVSLRSRHKIDVSAIAKHFGGGGHMYAAGFEVLLIGAFDSECDKLLEEILQLAYQDRRFNQI